MALFGEALILTVMGALASFAAPRGELATSYGDCPKSSMRVAVGTTPNRIPVKVGGFWREEFRRLTVKWIPHCIREMEKGGRGEELLLATGKPADVDAAYRLLEGADAVLAGHPTHDVRRWIARARDCAEGDEALANAYETNARRIITTWGPALDGYAARFWSGTVKDYYLARLRLVREAKKTGDNAKVALDAFQKQWIDGRLPIAPPVPGWTSEKLAEETLVLGRRFLSAKALRPCTM